MQESWAENPSQSLRYTEEYLSSSFEYPGAHYGLAPALYDGSSLVAFGAAFPRRIRIADRRLNIVVISLLTVANEYKRRGLGIVVWNEIVKRARAAGFDGMVNYCVDGEAMNGMILGCCRMLKLPTVRVYAVRYLSRVLWPKKGLGASPACSADLTESFLQLTEELGPRVPLTRVWSRADVEWQCRRRFGSVVAEVSSGTNRGMLVGYIMPAGSANGTKCLMIEDVLWGGLETDDRGRLLDTFLDKGTSAGARLAVLPVLGYAELGPFHSARFRPSQRLLHTYLTIWNGAMLTSELPSMYLDVF